MASDYNKRTFLPMVVNKRNTHISQHLVIQHITEKTWSKM